jgi:guanine deaminase
MSNDEKYILKAIQLARQSMTEHSGGPFGALIVIDDKIIGEGKNSVISLNDPTAHAEIMAIRNACQKTGSHNLEGGVIYTSCEPCPMCLGAIYWARIKRIVFAASHEDASSIGGFDDEHFYNEINCSWDDRKIESCRIKQSEGRQVFQEWKNKNDKQMY